MAIPAFLPRPKQRLGIANIMLNGNGAQQSRVLTCSGKNPATVVENPYRSTFGNLDSYPLTWKVISMIPCLDLIQPSVYPANQPADVIHNSLTHSRWQGTIRCQSNARQLIELFLGPSKFVSLER